MKHSCRQAGTQKHDYQLRQERKVATAGETRR